MKCTGTTDDWNYCRVEKMGCSGCHYYRKETENERKDNKHIKNDNNKTNRSIENKVITACELTELVLKFEKLKEEHNLNYIIYTECSYRGSGGYIQSYNIQSLEQFGELLTQMCRDWEVTVTHITSHIGKKGE